MNEDAKRLLNALLTLKLCWFMNKSNDKVKKCASMLKEKFRYDKDAYDSLQAIETSPNPMYVILVSEWSF